MIAKGIDPEAEVEYLFDDGAWIVMAPDRRDVPLSEEFVADHFDAHVADAIRLRRGL